jgi:hypothetical protein
MGPCDLRLFGGGQKIWAKSDSLYGQHTKANQDSHWARNSNFCFNQITAPLRELIKRVAELRRGREGG